MLSLEKVIVAAQTPTKKCTCYEVNDTGLYFIEKVPVEIVELSCPVLNSAHAKDYAVIDTIFGVSRCIRYEFIVSSLYRMGT